MHEETAQQLSFFDKIEAQTAVDLKPQVGYVCLMEMLDYVFYASRDYGSLVVTAKNIINNYAICYALGAACVKMDDNRQMPYPVSQPQPKDKQTYQRDFWDLPFYLTPARPVKQQGGFDEAKTFGLKSAFVHTKMKTYNTIPERFSDRFLRNYEKIYPSYGRYEMIAPESKYIFTVFSEQELYFPRYIRLGKFKAAAEIQVLGSASIRKGENDEFKSEPVHYNDLPENLTLAVYDLIRLGKAHAVLTNLTAKGGFWEFNMKRLRYRIPVSVRFCRRRILS